MKPIEIAKHFSAYLEEGTTGKGIKIQSFFSHLTASEKRIVAQNVAKAYAGYLQDEKAKADLRKKKKKEIIELKKKAIELGLVISEA